MARDTKIGKEWGVNNTKLTNWLLATLTATLMAMVTVGWTNITQANVQIAILTTRVSVVESINADNQRRLIRIEDKLDNILQWGGGSD